MAAPEEFARPPTKPFDIAVIGGGIAGVILTLQLLKHGMPTTLYEQAQQFGEIGAGVSFGPNATHAMELISPHVRDALQRARAVVVSASSSSSTTASSSTTSADDDRWFDFRFGDLRGRDGDNDVATGEDDAEALICTVRCSGGQQSVHRAHLLDELVKLLPPGVAKLGKRVVDYRYCSVAAEDEEGRGGGGGGGESGGVLLQFEDGSSARHDAVAACDGIKSRVRTLLLSRDVGGEEAEAAAKPVFSGKYAYRGLIPMAEAEVALGKDRARSPTMYFGKHGHVLTFPISGGETMNVVAFHSRPTWTSHNWIIPASNATLASDFAGWGPSVSSIVQLLLRQQQKSVDVDVWALFNHPPAPTYTHGGRVVLVGDAAHASTPHKGAGAGMAVEDAFVLGGLLAEVEVAESSSNKPKEEQLEAAFRAYDRTRRPRSLRLVEDSREQGRLYDLEMEGVGDDARRIAESLGERMRWLWEYDLERELAEAKAVMRALLFEKGGENRQAAIVSAQPPRDEVREAL